MRATLEERATIPSLVHRFIAALPTFLREHRKSGQLYIFTTNYDTLMEQALIEAGEKFHLLYYVNDLKDGRGAFP